VIIQPKRRINLNLCFLKRSTGQAKMGSTLTEVLEEIAAKTLSRTPKASKCKRQSK